MNQNFIKLLLSLCLLLFIILLVELKFAESTENQDLQALQSDHEENQQSQLPAIQFSGQTPDMYAEMVERPLFIEGRRPVIESVGDNDDQEADSKVEDLVLMGVYAINDKMTALFSKLGTKQTYLKKTQGDEIGGWILEEIRDDSVILEKSGVEETLILRKPKLQPMPKKPSRKLPQPVKPKS